MSELIGASEFRYPRLHPSAPHPQCAAMPATRTRLHRSELAVPGSNIRMLEQAPPPAPTS